MDNTEFLERRVEQLETCAVINAETIGQVERLRVAVLEQHDRIGKLEDALEAWRITVNWHAAALPMNKQIGDDETL